MGNSLTASGEQRVSPSRFFKPKRRAQTPAAFRLVSPASPTLQPTRHKRTRSQSGGLSSDCGTAASTTDSQPPRESGHMSPLEELSSSDKSDDQARRIREAEKILLEVAKEYAAKRAAGLVPTKPVPARTLLWEEMERRAQRMRHGVGRRGTCVFGRDSDDGPCGCASYKKMKRLPDGSENTGGVCECCKHGAPWHRLTGGTMTASGSGSVGVSMTRSSARSSMRSKSTRSRASSRNSHTASRSGQAAIDSSLYSLGSDYYDEYDNEYDSDYDSDEDSDEDDEDIANEVARPYAMMDDPTPPLMHSHARSEGDAATDRTSLLSNGDNFGLPPRLSSTSGHLDKLLGAIAKYKAMGLSEDEIEIRIRQEFPPTERLSYGGARPTRASR